VLKYALHPKLQNKKLLKTAFGGSGSFKVIDVDKARNAYHQCLL